MLEGSDAKTESGAGAPPPFPYNYPREWWGLAFPNRRHRW